MRLVVPDKPITKDIGDVLAIGFATSVAMWAIGYFSHLPGVVAPGWVVFALLVLCMVGGGVAAGVLTARRGWEPGLVTAIVNLLVLGSLLGKESGDLRHYAALWLGGAIGATLLCVMLGVLAGRLLRRRDAPAANWPAALAGVTAAATVLLLILGGNVTGFRAGMAVPDWPTTFKVNMFLYPLARMTGGIYFEHAHRLIGSLVGLTTLTLALYVQWRETRGWVRALAWCVFAAVVVQGLVGGFRVTENNLLLATIHGVFAQVCLSAMVIVALVLSNTWRERRGAYTHTHAARDRAWGTLAVLAILTQVILGAIYRHFGEGLYVHVGFALVALIA